MNTKKFRGFLPQYFNSNSYISFSRQLNMYNFFKPSPKNSKNTFKHRYFDIEKPEQFWKITRKTLKVQKIDLGSDSKECPEDTEFELLKEKARIKACLTCVKDTNKILKQNNENLQKQVNNIRNQKLNQIKKIFFSLSLLINKKNKTSNDNLEETLKKIDNVFSKKRNEDFDLYIRKILIYLKKWKKDQVSKNTFNSNMIAKGLFNNFKSVLEQFCKIEQFPEKEQYSIKEQKPIEKNFKAHSAPLIQQSFINETSSIGDLSYKPFRKSEDFFEYRLGDSISVSFSDLTSKKDGDDFYGD